MFSWFSGSADDSADAEKTTKPGFHPVELPQSPVTNVAPTAASASSSPPHEQQSTHAPAPPESESAPTATSSSAGGLFGGMSLSAAAGRRRRQNAVEAAPGDDSSPHVPTKDTSAHGESTFFANAAHTLNLNEPLEEGGHDVVRASQFRRRLEAFFREYCPTKLPLVDQLAEEFAEDEEALMSRLVAKHGPEPARLQEGHLPTSHSSGPVVNSRGSHTAASHSQRAPSASATSAFAFVAKNAAAEQDVRAGVQRATSQSLAKTHTAQRIMPSCASSSSPSQSESPEQLPSESGLDVGLPRTRLSHDGNATLASASPSEEAVVVEQDASGDDVTCLDAPTPPTADQGKEALLHAQRDVAQKLQTVQLWLRTSKEASVQYETKEKEVEACVKREAYEDADAAHSEAEECLNTLKTTLASFAQLLRGGLQEEKAKLEKGVLACVEALDTYERELLAVQSHTIESLEARVRQGDAALTTRTEAHAVALQQAHTALEESTVAKSRIKSEAAALKAALRESTASATTDVEALTDKCDALQQDIRTLEAQLEALRGQYDSASKALSEAMNKHEEMEDEYDAKLQALAADLADEEDRQTCAVEAQRALSEASQSLDKARVEWEVQKAELLNDIATCKSGAATAKEQRAFLRETHAPQLDLLLSSLVETVEKRFQGHGVLYTVPLCLLADAECRALLEKPSPLARQITLQRDRLMAEEQLAMTRQLVTSLTARTTELRTRVPVLEAEKEASVANKAFRDAKEKSDEIHRVQSTITAGEEELQDLKRRLQKEAKRVEHLTTTFDQEKALSRGRVMAFLSTYQETLRRTEGTLQKLRGQSEDSQVHRGFTAPELVESAAELLQELTGEVKLAEEKWRTPSSNQPNA